MSAHPADPHPRSPEDGRTLAPFGRRRALVVSTRKVGAYVLLELSDRDGPPSDPGQFHMLATRRHWGAGEDERPFLPRAFSPMGASGGHLWFMLEDVGPGTHRLTTLKKGEGLWVNGPFGRGFRPPAPARRPILVAGGIGLPPIMHLSQDLTRQGVETAMLLGFRDAAHAQVAASFAGAQLATDDGSAGHHGYVTALLAAELDRDPAAEVFACGPGPMLEAVRALVTERDVPAQLALESGMACGFGACYGCVVPLAAGGYARVCVDGPVMAAADLAAVPAH
jgi:dihydroorotate dehydrogenase electron transfer subunit